ncbi:unnamed protein product, partial [Effrenium voratum]
MPSMLSRSFSVGLLGAHLKDKPTDVPQAPGGRGRGGIWRGLASIAMRGDSDRSERLERSLGRSARSDRRGCAPGFQERWDSIIGSMLELRGELKDAAAAKQEAEEAKAELAKMQAAGSELQRALEQSQAELRQAA